MFVIWHVCIHGRSSRHTNVREHLFKHGNIGDAIIFQSVHVCMFVFMCVCLYVYIHVYAHVSVITMHVCLKYLCVYMWCLVLYVCM
jgi:hypothetical protein